jgi:FlaA1/EpsC-like NDP-sugar epimerase
MIHLSGLTERTPEHPDGDIPIEYVGLRPGEKLYEELLIGESVVPSGHPRIMCARERHIEPALLDKMLESLRPPARPTTTRPCSASCAILVPEYRSA